MTRKNFIVYRLEKPFRAKICQISILKMPSVQKTSHASAQGCLSSGLTKQNVKMWLVLPTVLYYGVGHQIG